MKFEQQRFTELSVPILYDILKLRSEVFVVEQNCIYQDIDNKDTLPETLHVFAYQNNTLTAYARVLPENVSYSSVSIGRVLVNKDYRGQGIASRLMTFCMEQALLMSTDGNIQIGAQCYLQSFYEALGFVQNSPAYDEDGIMHLDMIYKKDA